jgi:hypothetical protein
VILLDLLLFTKETKKLDLAHGFWVVYSTIGTAEPKSIDRFGHACGGGEYPAFLSGMLKIQFVL